MKERTGRIFILTGLEVWAVVYGSHEPPMVESLWDNQYGAEQHAQELNDSSLTCPWGTMGWNIRRHEQ